MLPLLSALGDGRERRIRDVADVVADQLGLTETERTQLLPSGAQRVVANRIGWARTYLKKAVLIENTARGVLKVTADGLRLLAERPTRIDSDFLLRYPTFREFVQPVKEAESSDGFAEPVITHDDAETPEEALESAHRTLQDALADDLLERVKSCSPAFFEKLVVELLVAMGYGGSRADAGQALGRSGDGGIDGIIKEDKLGLDVVCLQAKRWTGTVGRPVVQAFAGSMEGYRARKGVLLTTATFSRDAEDYITRIERKIVLIDLTQLARLMIEHNVGAAISRTYIVKRVDLDYFDDEAG